MQRFAPKPFRKPLDNKVVLPPSSPPDRAPKFQRVYDFSSISLFTTKPEAKKEHKQKHKIMTKEELRAVRRKLSPIYGYEITNIGVAQAKMLNKSTEFSQTKRCEFLSLRRSL